MPKKEVAMLFCEPLTSTVYDECSKFASITKLWLVQDARHIPENNALQVQSTTIQ